MSLSSMLKWFYLPLVLDHNKGVDNIYSEKEFLRVLGRERAKAGRSIHQFSLVVFDPGPQDGDAENKLLTELSARMRTTDEVGRLQDNLIGAILHNATANEAWIFAHDIQKAMLAGGNPLLCKVYTYPIHLAGNSDSDEKEGAQQPARGTARQEMNYTCPVEDIQAQYARKMTTWKRGLDIFGSLFGLFILSPVFFLLWCLIKSVSPGPAIYRQTRIGLGGRPFTFFKFRTMANNADTTEHRQYLSSLIKGEKTTENCDSNPMTKLDDNNANIIPFGKIIRKTYLDELPQLVNVLLGDMSLIGPRPPIPYEVAEYQLWHTDRFDTTPGMTGLWQVSGKNKLTFDQMVRLDIQYIRKQSIWLDIKILLMTPLTIALEIKESLLRISRQSEMGAEELIH